MKRLVIWLVLATVVVACSTRSVVVKPEEVSKLGDAQWAITSEPSPASR